MLTGLTPSTKLLHQLGRIGEHQLEGTADAPGVAVLGRHHQRRPRDLRRFVGLLRLFGLVRVRWLCRSAFCPWIDLVQNAGKQHPDLVEVRRDHAAFVEALRRQAQEADDLLGSLVCG